MAETKRKPGRPKKVEKVETLEDEIEILDPGLAVDRELEFEGETKTYVQTQLPFVPKLRFFRLLKNTLEVASGENRDIAEFIQDAWDSVNTEGDVSGDFVEVLFGVIEVLPEFAEEAFLLILKVPTNEQAWARNALEDIDDDTAIDIIDVFLAQNAQAVRDFFTKKLRKPGARIRQITEQE